MGPPKSWEEYLWKDLHIVPVPDLNKGRINLLDIFVQDGRTYHMRHLLSSGPDKPFRRRELVHVGSMITFGDEDVQGWLDKKTDLDDDLKGLSDDEDDDTPVNEPFTKGVEGKDRKTVVRADSKFLARFFGVAKANFDTSRNFEVKISSPSYRRVMENHFLEFIGAKQGKKAQWKPDIGSVSSVERKGTSIFNSDGILELWIVTELKFGTINYTVQGGGGVGAEVNLQGLEGATPVPVAGGLKATTSASVSVESDEAAANENALYGFQAIRLKFDTQGNYVSRRGNMGQTRPHVHAWSSRSTLLHVLCLLGIRLFVQRLWADVRELIGQMWAGVTKDLEEDDLEVDSDFEYHMNDFFFVRSGGSNDRLLCSTYLSFRSHL